MAIQLIKNTFYFCYSAYKKIEPFQPIISSWVITGKVLWIQTQYSKWDKEIRNLSRHINMMTRILQHTDTSETHRASLRKSIHALTACRKEKKYNLKFKRLSWAQVPSLIFPTPLFNLWNTGHAIVSRGVVIQNAINPHSADLQSSTQQIATIAGGVISIVGTSTSFLRQLKIVSSDNPLGHILVGLAIGVSAIEGIYLVKDYLGRR
jgi:hypothetical protein